MRKPQITKSINPVLEGKEDVTERIRQRAYELYEARERQGGHELDDWLLAEAEAMQQVEQ